MKFVHVTAFTTVALMIALIAGSMTSAHASYIDPGTTSYLFQMAIAGVFGLLYTARQMLKRMGRKAEQESKGSE